MALVKKRCESCDWWKRFGDGITTEGTFSGKCHIQPPSAESGFPVTQSDDFCPMHHGKLDGADRERLLGQLVEIQERTWSIQHGKPTNEERRITERRLADEILIHLQI